MTDSYLARLLGVNERIILVIRQHWFVLFRAIFIEILLALAIIAGVILAGFTDAIAPFAMFGLVLLVIPIFSLGWDVIVWNNRKYIVTNRRVIQISGVINKNVIDSSLEKVNDVRLDQSFWGRIFDYGDVEIMTASELGTNKFVKLGNPIRFKTAMVNAKEKLEFEMASQAKSEIHDDQIPDMIVKLDTLRKQGLITEEEFRQQKKDLLRKI